MNISGNTGTVMRAMRKGDQVAFFVGEQRIGFVSMSHVPNGMKIKVAFSFDKAIRIEADRPKKQEAR